MKKVFKYNYICMISDSVWEGLIKIFSIANIIIQAILLVIDKIRKL